MTQSMTRIVVPEFAGTRWAAEQLMADANPQGGEAVIDFTGCLSAAQGFCDELVGQLASRGKAVVEVVGASERVQGYLAVSMRLRGLPSCRGILTS